MEAFVINLQYRTDRWEKITHTFSSILKLHRVEAIKNEPGWLGCLQSHQLCLKKAKELQLSTCLVIEDDCQLTTTPENFIKEWKIIKDWLDNNLDRWNIFYGGCANVKSTDVYGIIQKLPNVELIQLEYATSTHFTYYNKCMYDKIINYTPVNNTFTSNTSNNNYFPIDVIISQKARGRIITKIPFLAIQREDFSDLEKRVIDYTNLYEESEKIIIENKDEGRKIISPFIRGGLGNRLFQIASSYGMAKQQEKKLEIIFHTLNPHSKIDYYENIFRKFTKNIDSVTNGEKWLKVEEQNFCDFTEELMDKNFFKDNNIQLNGYFQREEYFSDIREEILELFEMEETRYNKLITRYPDVKNRFFIHVRKGDYVGNPIHDISLDKPNGYYEEIIKFIKSTYGSESKFYLFSNDIDWCSKVYFFQDPNIEYITDLDELDSLYLMSLCERGGIGCNSSFSWWGGYLNKNPNKFVIYPNKWINNSDVNISWKNSYYYKI